MVYEIRFRKGPSNLWAARNPVLGLGEPGYESDTGKMKIGDGVHAWLAIPYFINESDLQALIEAIAVEGPPGPEGDSAYQVALDNGFSGTQSQWLASLVGPPGDNGDDGEPGQDGDDGAPGLSAYQVAVANGFVGNQSQWLASLVGAPGSDGEDGEPGQDGADGESVTVTLVPAASWPPAADSNPLHLYFRVP